MLWKRFWWMAARAVRDALAGMQTGQAFTVRGSWPRSTDDGVLITVGEYTNVATDCPVVDEIAYQVDLWAFDGRPSWPCPSWSTRPSPGWG